MNQFNCVRRSGVLGLALLLCLQTVPVLASTTASTLSGTVVSMADESMAPVAGARVYLADTRSDRIYTSDATTASGGFRVGELPASVYNVAVELDAGLFIVESPVALNLGQTRELHLAVYPGRIDPAAGSPAAAKKILGIWENPLTATLVLLGVAVVAGLIVAEIDEDERSSVSPSTP